MIIIIIMIIFIEHLKLRESTDNFTHEVKIANHQIYSIIILI